MEFDFICIQKSGRGEEETSYFRCVIIIIIKSKFSLNGTSAVRSSIPSDICCVDHHIHVFTAAPLPIYLRRNNLSVGLFSFAGGDCPTTSHSPDRKLPANESSCARTAVGPVAAIAPSTTTTSAIEFCIFLPDFRVAARALITCRC